MTLGAELVPVDTAMALHEVSTGVRLVVSVFHDQDPMADEQRAGLHSTYAIYRAAAPWP